ncbi:hypothetical protein WI40_17205 [Burkholderia ubonensis]|nr:hypothetical protein WI40_17205 [Burkholderia ubonensis]
MCFASPRSIARPIRFESSATSRLARTGALDAQVARDVGCVDVRSTHVIERFEQRKFRRISIYDVYGGRRRGGRMQKAYSPPDSRGPR